MTDPNTPQQPGSGETPQQPAAPEYPQAPAYPGTPAQGQAPSAYGVPPAYPQAPGYAQAPGYGYPEQPKTNTLAIVSLIFGIAGFVILPLIASIVAVITGHMSLNQLKTSGEGGRGLALAGTILGWVGVAFGILSIILLLVFLPMFLWALNDAYYYSMAF